MRNKPDNKAIAGKQPLDAEIIRDAMEFAADYSAKNCLKPGGFGFEHKLAEMKDGQASIS